MPVVPAMRLPWISASPPIAPGPMLMPVPPRSANALVSTWSAVFGPASPIRSSPAPGPLTSFPMTKASPVWLSRMPTVPTSVTRLKTADGESAVLRRRNALSPSETFESNTGSVELAKSSDTAALSVKVL